MIKITIQSVSGKDYFKIKESPAEFFDSKPKHYELSRNSGTNEDSETLLVSVRNITNRDYLFSNVSVESIEVDGETYGTFEDLSSVLAPILFKKGGGDGSGVTEIFESDWIAVMPEDARFGYIKNGDNVPAGGKTPGELMYTVTNKAQTPTFTNPSFSLTMNQTGVKEVGVTLSIILTGNLNRGSINGNTTGGSGWNPSAIQNPRSGAAEYYILNGTNTDTTATRTFSYVVLNGTNNFSGSVKTFIGPQPKDSNGDNYNDPLPAQNLSNTISLSGLYPYFFGVINEDQTIDNIDISTLTKVVASSISTISIAYSNIVGKKLVILIPASSTIKTKWYINALNNGNIGNSGDIFPSIQTKNFDSPDSNWLNQSFRVYISTVTSINTTIQLQN